MKIDFDNIRQRILALPMPARRYVGLQAGKAGTLLALEAPRRRRRYAGPGGPALTVHRFDLKAAQAPTSSRRGVRFFEISANGEKTLTAQGDRWTHSARCGRCRRLDAVRRRPRPARPGPAGPGPGGAGTLRTDAIEVTIDPRAEWTQMYREAWRIQREFFYDPSLHGLDLPAADQEVRAVSSTSVESRRDLNYLFADMMGEITVGHLGVGGGDMPEREDRPDGPARRRLQDRERPLPLRPHLQRRELESRTCRRR